MRRKILSLLLGSTLAIAAAAPVAAAGNADCDVQNDGRGGAAALVALVNANVLANVGVNACDIDVLNNSLNNLLRNADIDVLSNILNNSPILNDSLDDFVISVGPTLNGVQVNILGGGVNLTEIDFDLTN
jgi:hypothetical protein